MHLHWKYRELVKILVKSKSFSDVKRTALSLEAESGGILVSVDKVSKGYAIVVFRGKNYRRPSTLRPRNLLSKRKALARSIELQRHQVPYYFLVCQCLIVIILASDAPKEKHILFFDRHWSPGKQISTHTTA
jgi:hypothetical protein